MMNRPLPTWVALALVGLLSSVLAWKTLAPVYDPDTWWHLKVGEWVMEHQAVPETDPFSRMSQETPTKWVAYSWLFEAALCTAQSHSNGGVYLVRAVLVGLSTAALLGFVLWRIGPAVLGLTVAAAATATLLPLTAERPWHVTIAFTTITTAVVVKLREGTTIRRLAWLPLIFVLWANIHIQFVLGWGVLGLACLFPGSAKRTTVILLTAACVLAVLVNPYHVRLFGVIWEYATQAQALRLVSELQPPKLSNPVTWAVVGLMALAFSKAVRTRPLDWYSICLLAAGAFFALRMQRDLWFGVLTTAAVLGRETTDIRFVRWGGLVCLVIFGLAAFAPRSDSTAVNAKHYPLRAVEYIREHRLPGPLFNHFNWGGYLIWALPEYPVSIDGRTNLYGNERVLQNYRSLTGEPGWEEDPALVSANLTILPSDCPLTELMRASKDWKVAYEDDTTIVFQR